MGLNERQTKNINAKYDILPRVKSLKFKGPGPIGGQLKLYR